MIQNDSDEFGYGDEIEDYGLGINGIEGPIEIN